MGVPQPCSPFVGLLTVESPMMNSFGNRSLAWGSAAAGASAAAQLKARDVSKPPAAKITASMSIRHRDFVSALLSIMGLKTFISISIGLDRCARRTGRHLECFDGIGMAWVKRPDVVHQVFDKAEFVGLDALHDAFGQFVAAVVIMVGVIHKSF